MLSNNASEKKKTFESTKKSTFGGLGGLGGPTPGAGAGTGGNNRKDEEVSSGCTIF
jgi:hypothetical protein